MQWSKLQRKKVNICVLIVFLEKHSGHIGIKSNLLEDNYLNKINKILTEEESINSDLIKFENNLKIKIEKIKKSKWYFRQILWRCFKRY